MAMDRIFLSLLCLSGWHGSTCLLRQYHYVGDAKTWTEAQTYCRETYADLATAENIEETNRLINTVSSAGHKTEFWFGLHTVIDWRWSDGFNGSGAEYRNWDTGDAEPDFYIDQFCVQVAGSTGKWFDVDCSMQRPQMCYTGTPLDPQFVFVDEKNLNWSDARRLCRENFTDLATVRNITESQKFAELVGAKTAWLGLFRYPNLFWSDGSNFSFSNWDTLGNPLGSRTVMCGSTSLARSGKWRVLSCETRLPFVCTVPVMRQVKLRMNPQGSVDLSNPAVKANLLAKLQDRLEENGGSGVTLKWKEQPDGEVFHKE